MTGWGGSLFTVALSETEPTQRDEPDEREDRDDRDGAVDDEVRPPVARYSTLDQLRRAASATRDGRRALGSNNEQRRNGEHRQPPEQGSSLASRRPSRRRGLWIVRWPAGRSPSRSRRGRASSAWPPPGPPRGS